MRAREGRCPPDGAECGRKGDAERRKEEIRDVFRETRVVFANCIITKIVLRRVVLVLKFLVLFLFLVSRGVVLVLVLKLLILVLFLVLRQVVLVLKLLVLVLFLVFRQVVLVLVLKLLVLVSFSLSV